MTLHGLLDCNSRVDGDSVLVRMLDEGADPNGRAAKTLASRGLGACARTPGSPDGDEALAVRAVFERR